MHCSPGNLRRMLCMLIERYVPGYHGRLPITDPISSTPSGAAAPMHRRRLPTWRRSGAQSRRATASERHGDHALATRPLLASRLQARWACSLRTVALSGNTAHLNALFRALEARGLSAHGL
ncbi:MAG: hypothetical protein U0Z44_04035 [Kouleothrix sp.]